MIMNTSIMVKVDQVLKGYAVFDVHSAHLRWYQPGYRKFIVS